ncbi:MAG: hypothetical protein RIS73_1156 [Bacteroidota bacterium]|jgi:hypothetical protein
MEGNEAALWLHLTVVSGLGVRQLYGKVFRNKLNIYLELRYINMEF